MCPALPRRPLRCWLAAAWLLLSTFLPPPGRAMTVVPRDFEALVARAETVFHGTVTGQGALWTGEGETRRIVTRVRFRVVETLKGELTAADGEQTLEFLGGTVDGETLEIPGMPRFGTGESAVLFVVNNGRQLCPLVGAYQGHFRVVAEPGGGEERILTHDLAPVVSTAEIGQVDAEGVPRLSRLRSTGPGVRVAITAAEFKRQIRQTLDARTARGAPRVDRSER